MYIWMVPVTRASHPVIAIKRNSQVDTEEAVREFEDALSAFDITGMAEEMGISKDMVEVRCFQRAMGKGFSLPIR